MMFVGNNVRSSTYNIDTNGFELSGINPARSKFSTDGTINCVKVNSGLTNVTIENMYFQGVGLKTTQSYLIYIDDNCSNITIRGCVFDGATGGIIVRPGCKNIFIIGCTFRNMVYIPGAGAASGGNYSAGGAGSYGVVFQEEPKTVQIYNSQVEVPGGVTHGVISGCVFEPTVVRHAVYIQSSSDVLICDNVIYGTTAMNNQTLMEALLTTGLTQSQINAFDATKHMTVYDSAISFRGCSNVRIINNYLDGGICCLNGSPDNTGNHNGGEQYLFKDNIVKNYVKPNDVNNNITAINRLFNLNNINTVVKENNTISNCTGYSQYWSS